MRPSIVAIVAIVLLASAPADAGSRSGDGGGGRLGQVSAGIGDATRAGNASSTSGGSTGLPIGDFRCDRRGDCDERACDHRGDCACDHRGDCERAEPVVLVTPSGPPVAGTASHDGATFEAYAGVQKVYESTGSLSVELAAVDVDRRFRLDGRLTRYYEDRMDGGRLAMTMWSLTGGLRIDDGGATRADLEAGAVGAKTQADPAGDSSITGFLAGVRVEHRLSRRSALIGGTHAMFFKRELRAYDGRVGFRFGHVEASLRMLDFNVGPALFGPELGMSF